MAHRICSHCGVEFESPRSTRRFSSRKCASDASLRPCSVSGCDGQARSGCKGLCGKHLARLQRHGDLATVLKRQAVNVTYMTVKAPEHQLSWSDGVVSVHRKVLFDRIGPGVHACHWCGQSVEWGGTGPTQLVVDHVDRDTHNNAVENLVPACTRCNTQRFGHPNALKTHCPKGHEYSPENTRWYRGWRYCRACTS